MTRLQDLPFENTYAALGESFYDRPMPSPFPDPYLIAFNPAAAELIELDPGEAQRPEFLQVFSGQQKLPDMDPVAMIYAGHQFGVFVPQLGDGRAMLLGEIPGGDGTRWDIQLKGAGPTAYSRGGDGRAVLRSTIREYLCSEAMHGLGIPTTRALAIIGSDMPVYREGVETAAILTRLAPSHVRFGSFEVFYHRGQFDRVRTLADHVIEQHYPELAGESEPYLALLEQIAYRTADLIARWQAVGFAHGVMNTDNMSVLGLTMDYGPFGFIDAYDPGFVCNHSDHGGRYAFKRQPEIGLWNLGCLGHAMLCLIAEDEAEAAEKAKAVLERYGPRFGTRYAELMQAKLGLRERRADDRHLVERLLALMAEGGTDYTLFFRQLSDFEPDGPNQPLRDMILDREGFDAWSRDYAARLRGEGEPAEDRARRMRRVNPKYVLRNYMAEIAIARAVNGHDFGEIEVLRQLLARPFDEHPELAHYAGLPPDWADQVRVSCSS